MSDTATATMPPTMVEAAPEKKSGKLSGADMGVMTIIIVIAIICAAFYCTNIFLNGPAATSSSSISQPEKVEYWSGYTVLPDGVAAKVNGVEISEGEITDYVALYRNTYDYEDNDNWALWVSQTYGDASGVRDFMVEYYVAQEVNRQAAEALGVSVTEDEINAMLDEQMANFDSEDAFWEAVEAGGNTRANLLGSIESSLLVEKITKKLQEIGYGPEVSDADVVAYIRASYPAYANIRSLDEVSEGISGAVREALEASAVSNAYTVYIQEFVDGADIEVAEMPEGLPYDVDTGQQKLAIQLATLIQQFQQAQQATTMKEAVANSSATPMQ